MKQFLFISAIGALVSGCASLLPTPEGPTKKYTLAALEGQLDRNWVTVPGTRLPQLIIGVPTLYSPLDNTRIALKPQEQSIDYYADVEWADRLGTLIQESLVYSLEDKGFLRGISRSMEGVQADYLLKVEVRKFYVGHKDEKEVPTAQVDYMAHLIKLPDRHIVASRRFSRSQKIPGQSMDAIIKSLNAAHVEVVKDLLPWIAEHAR